MRRLIPVVVAVLLAGCTTDDDTGASEAAGAGPSTTTVSPTTVAPAATSAPSTTSPATATSTTTAPTTTSSTPTTTTSTTTAGGSTTTTQYVSPVSEGASLPAAQPRTSIPWNDVDANWLLTLYDGVEAEVLYLVSPRSDLFEIASWDPGSRPSHTLADWSPDLRHALIRRFNPMPVPALELQLLDLKSGEVSVIESIPYVSGSDAEPLRSLWGRFTRPTGENLMVFRSVDGVVSLDRRTAAGTILATFEAVGPWLYSPDGTAAVIGDNNGLHLHRNDGAFLRDLPVDSEGTPLATAPLRWWSDDTLLATTRRHGDPQARGHASWDDVSLVTVSLSSDSIVTLDGAAGVSSEQQFEGAWAIGDRILIETSNGWDHYQYFWQTHAPLSFEDDYGNHRVLGTIEGDLIVFALDRAADRGLIARYDVDSAPGETAESIQILVPHVGNAKGVVEGLFQDTVATRDSAGWPLHRPG